MKKILATAIIGTFAILPTFALAQTTSSESDSALIATLIQLVQTVQQEVAALQAEMNALAEQSGTSTGTTVAPTASTPNLVLSIASSTLNSSATSAYIAWTTNVPATSKVFLTNQKTNAVQVVSSPAGDSEQGFVNLPLTTNTTYTFTVEAIAGNQDQKISGYIFTSIASPSITVSGE